ncbi:MAG: hypothetical protein IT435_19515 [Phycisphaerales bacterium]|nr:hypothetical protein [Phycisphaerales bacterium]
MNQAIPGAVGRWSRSIAAAALFACSLAAFPASIARADEYVDRVNALYASTKTEKRSDLVILPLLAKMDPPPRAVDEADPLLLIAPDQSAWADVKTWIEGANQKALIDAIYKITEAKDSKDSMVFALPYGVEGVSPELVQARMYVELGDPPLLAAANIQYLPGLKRLHRLAQLEAIRRSSEGDTIGGLEMLVRLAFFGRQLAERPLHNEVKLGYTMIWQAMERMRDIAYMDYRGKKSLQSQAQISKLPDIINRQEDDKGVFALERLPFPIGDRAAAEQLVARVMQEKGGPNKDTFATTMARIKTGGRPLKLFGEAGRWQLAMSQHGDWYATTEQLEKLYNDWQSKWRLDPFDARMLQPFYAQNMNKRLYAVLDASAPAIGELFPMRQFIRTQIAGTRHALAVLGFFYVNKGWPPQLASVRPNFIKALTADPFNPNRAHGQQPTFEYFVPIRDAVQANIRTEKQPHEMTVFVPDGSNFILRLRDDTFVLYSTGPDGGKNRAERIQNVWTVVRDTDLLVWPPVSSLWRQHQRDAGPLK